MEVRARSAFGLILPLFLLLGCEWNHARRANQITRLVQTMGVELRSTADQAAAAFSARSDFEVLRKAFGDERLDAGTPLGPDFQANLATMIRDLETQLEKEPKDAEFPRKAVRKVRQFSQWWTFIRVNLEARRDKLAQAPPEDREALRLWGGRMRRADVLTVLSETIKVVEAFEAISARCLRGIEGILTHS